VSTAENWLDEEIRSFAIGSLVQTGENRLTLHAERFKTLHEIAPAYVVGDFSARVHAQGFELSAGSGIPMGHWADQGLPFYKDGVLYTGHIQLARSTKRLRVEVGDWRGSLVRVSVDGCPIGRVWREPATLEVEMHLGAGGMKSGSRWWVI
jgi:hypothetical protein